MSKQIPWYKSSTIVVNLIAVLIPILDIIVNTNLIPDKDIYVIVVAILNILNRFRVSPVSEVKPVARKVI